MLHFVVVLRFISASSLYNCRRCVWIAFSQSILATVPCIQVGRVVISTSNNSHSHGLNGYFTSPDTTQPIILGGWKLKIINPNWRWTDSLGGQIFSLNSSLLFLLLLSFLLSLLSLFSPYLASPISSLLTIFISSFVSLSCSLSPRWSIALIVVSATSFSPSLLIYTCTSSSRSILTLLLRTLIWCISSKIIVASRNNTLSIRLLLSHSVCLVATIHNCINLGNAINLVIYFHIFLLIFVLTIIVAALFFALLCLLLPVYLGSSISQSIHFLLILVTVLAVDVDIDEHQKTDKDK